MPKQLFNEIILYCFLSFYQSVGVNGGPDIDISGQFCAVINHGKSKSWRFLSMETFVLLSSNAPASLLSCEARTEISFQVNF